MVYTAFNISQSPCLPAGLRPIKILLYCLSRVKIFKAIQEEGAFSPFLGF